MLEKLGIDSDEQTKGRERKREERKKKPVALDIYNDIYGWLTTYIMHACAYMCV